MPVGVLIMAAGHSRRYREYGGQHKLLVRHPECGNLPLMAHSLQLATAVCGRQVRVVLRPEDRALIDLARHYPCSITLLDSEGLGDSIAAGVAAQPHWSGWLVMLADMPWLLPETLQQVCKALSVAATARPLWQQQPGHPVGFSAELRRELLALSGQQGARELLATWPPLLLPVEDPGCVRDVDVPDDWQGGC